MGNLQFRWVRASIFVIIVGLGIVAEITPLHLMFDLKFAFTAVCYLIVLQLFGYRQALAAIFIVYGANYFIDSFQTVRFVLALLEITFVSFFLRSKGRNMLTWDLLFWLISWPIVSYALYTVDHFELYMIVLLHGYVNALICVLLAETLSELIVRPPLIRPLFTGMKPMYFGKMITLMIYLSAVLPICAFILYNGVLLEESMIAQVKTELEMASNRVEERLSGMDANELLNLELGSIVQKAYLTSMFDYVTAENELEILVFHAKGELYTYSGADAAVHHRLTLLEDGYLAEIDDTLYVWLPEANNNLSDWAEGYYFKAATFSNLYIFSVLPIQSLLLSHVNIIKNYYQVILLVFVIAVGIAFVCKSVLSKSLSLLTNLTTDLPKRMEHHEEFVSERSYIHEFQLLNENFEVVAKKLKQMFQESNRKNRLLTKRTEQLTSSKKQLEYLVHYDDLTGLLNRRSFQEDVAELLAESKQMNREFAILFMDIDQFKQVNDILGHSGGDELLKCFGQRLHAFVAQTDTMHAYRIGGDEFIVTIGHHDLQQIDHVIQQLLAELSLPFELLDSSYTVSQSVGVSLFPKDGEQVEELIRHADQAMYQVKKSGRNGIEFYDRKVDSR